MRNLVILGSTGSIGRQALEVVQANPGLFRVAGLSGHSQRELLEAQAVAFKVPHVATEASDIAALAALPEADVVVNALVGFAGLRASYAALTAGKTLCLANKESLVVAGDLLMPLCDLPGVTDGRDHASYPALYPIDSEHSAIWQCLVGEDPASVRKLWITCSGGAFRGMTRAQLRDVKAADALKHPTWQMGAKITIDSATLLNKGFEVIEAHYLFGLPYERIEAILHPQSVVHSMVEFSDGAVKAQLGAPDMRLPIQYALLAGNRVDTEDIAKLDFNDLAALTFGPIDRKTFRCFDLAMQAARLGGTATCVLNAAGEVANLAFRQDRIPFLKIEQIIERTLSAHDVAPVESVEHLEAIDAWARTLASSLL